MAKKQGFVFTVLALAVIAMVILSVGVWVRTFEAGEARSSDRFKGEALRSIMYAISDESLSDFAKASAFYATYKLVNYSAGDSGHTNGVPADCSIVSDLANPCTANVERYAESLMENGTPPSNVVAPALNYNEAENLSYTLGSWRSRVSESAWLMGFNVTFSSPYNFTFRQDSPWDVTVAFEMDMNLSDLAKTMHQSRKMKANATFPITGFQDPMITRNEYIFHNQHGQDLAQVAVRQIYRDASYNSPSDVKPSLLAPISSGPSQSSVQEGVGWFFGPIISFYPNMTAPASSSQYILYVSSYDDTLPVVASQFGAVLLTMAPNTTTTEEPWGGCVYNVTRQYRCLNCLEWGTTNMAGCPPYPKSIWKNEVSMPMIVATNMQLPGGIHREGTDPNDLRFILIDSENTDRIDKTDSGYERRVWDLNRPRDMAICGFYVHDGNRAAPSFFQRMLGGTPANDPQVSAEFGIESFVVGKWAGGAEDWFGSNAPSDAYSRLDWEFYRKTELNVHRVKGMPGCKSEWMCGSENATKEALGHFALTNDALSRYGMENITYSSSGPHSIK